MSTDHDHPIDPERVAHARSRLPNAEDAARLTGLLAGSTYHYRLLAGSVGGTTGDGGVTGDGGAAVDAAPVDLQSVG